MMVRTHTPNPPGVDPDFDQDPFAHDRAAADDLVKCPACGGRGRNILLTTSCDLCDGEGRVAL